MAEKITTFISYAHDSDEHRKRVLKLADSLVKDGVFCVLDQYEDFPEEGWLKWMSNHIEESDYIIVVCSKRYNARVKGEGKIGVGNGVKYESMLTLQELYENGSRNTKILPVIFTDSESEHIPLSLKPFQIFCLNNPNGYENLYRKITDQPKLVRPELGQIKKLKTGINNSDSYFVDNVSSDTPTKSQGEEYKTIELTIDRDFDNYSLQDQEVLLDAIAKLLKVSDSEIRIKGVRKGSVIVTVELSKNLAIKLLYLIEEGALDKYGVLGSIKSVKKTKELAKELEYQEKAKRENRVRGTIKWFNEEKGFGFISPDDGGADIFVSFRDIVGSNFTTLSVGQVVSFVVEKGTEGYKAVSVEIIA